MIQEPRFKTKSKTLPTEKVEIPAKGGQAGMESGKK